MKLDHTALATLDRCEVEFTWRHVHHLAPTGVSAAAHFGQVLHVGVRALYDGHSVAECQAAMRTAWTTGMEAEAVASLLADGPRHCVVCGGWGGETNVFGGRGKHLTPVTCICKISDFAPTYDANKLHLSLWRAFRTLDVYAQEWGLCNARGDALAPATFDVVWNEGYAESATECGLPDRAVRMHADGLLYAMDLKTTGMYVSADWQRSFEHSQQAAMQLDILEAALGMPLAGFWLDAIHVRRDGVPRKDDFSRYGPLAYSAELRAELREQRFWKAARAHDLREYAHRYPELARKSPGACIRYNALCPYFDLCKAAPAERPALVQIALAKGTLKEQMWKPSQRD